jgi:hypothetical protein
MRKDSSNFKALLIGAFLTLFIVISAVAQPPGDPINGDPDGSVPISGIEILIAAGGILGIRKFLSRKKSN